MTRANGGVGGLKSLLYFNHNYHYKLGFKTGGRCRLEAGKLEIGSVGEKDGGDGFVRCFQRKLKREFLYLCRLSLGGLAGCGGMDS